MTGGPSLFLRPDGHPVISVIDSHAGGEPFRVVIDGLPTPRGSTILERRQDAQANHDSWRRILMWEPRGHADMYGGWLVPPQRSDSDLGVLFMHNDGFSTMCGHGIIALTTVALETGMIDSGVDTLQIDTPAGKVVAKPTLSGKKVESVAFENVASYAHILDASADVPGLGSVRYDIAFGGAFYAYVDASELGVSCTPADSDRLVDLGRRIKLVIGNTQELTHPTEPDLEFLYGVIFSDKPKALRDHWRNVCIFADGELDRSPTGTGVSGRLAIERARGTIEAGQDVVVESILGSVFTGRVVGETTHGPYPTVKPEITGSAFVIGTSTFWVDPDDELGRGFLLS